MAKLITEIVKPLLHKFPTITLSDKDMYLLDHKCLDIIKEKLKEKQYKDDGNNLEDRYGNGTRGEMALQRFIQREYIDLTAGYTKNYNYPDCWDLGLSIGVKTSDYRKGNSALVPKKTEFCEPQVIVLMLEDNTFAICGYADERTINTYRSDEYVKDSNAKNKWNAKTGFIGYDRLIQFNTWKELRELAKPYLVSV